MGFFEWLVPDRVEKAVKWIIPDALEDAVEWIVPDVVEDAVGKAIEGAEWVIPDIVEDKIRRAVNEITTKPENLKAFIDNLFSSDLWKRPGTYWANLGVSALELGEVLYAVEEIVNTLTYFSSRGLTEKEISLAKNIFGNSIDYDLVRINDSDILTRSNAYVFRNTIVAESLDDATLIHELTHVWQFQNNGADYISEALIARKWGDAYEKWGDGYEYGGVNGLQKAYREGKKFTDFNPEQQASIVEDYFLLLKNPQNSNIRIYAEFVKQVSTLSIQQLAQTNSNVNTLQHTLTGNDTYKWNPDETFLEVIWDGGGNDKIDASNQDRNVVIDLEPNEFSSIGSYNRERDAINNLLIAHNVTIENAEGGAGHDRIYGNSTNNNLRGNVGNDRVYGRIGNDWLYGDSDDDYLNGGSGNDWLYGGSNNDYLDGGSGYDRMYGGSGNDTYVIDDSGDKVYEGVNQGTDTIWSTVSYRMGENEEELYLIGNSQPGFNDTPYLIGKYHSYQFESNNEEVFYMGIAYKVYNFGYQPYQFGFDSDTNQFAFHLYQAHMRDSKPINGYGNDQDNYIEGNWANNHLQGYGGNDTLYGNKGDDFLGGWSGDDKLWGGAGNDKLYGDSGRDELYGGAGDDWINGGSGKDYHDGGAGIDTIDYTHARGDNTYNLATGTVSATHDEQILNFENINTGSGNETIIGTNGGNVINSDAGNDTVNGGRGNDTINGGAGNDTIDGGLHLDTMDGGSGIDTLDVTFWNGTYELNMTTGVTNYLGETAVNFENVNTGSGKNKIIGTSGSNVINTGAGDDIINGGSGHDTLNGGLGSDTLTGGLGADKFLFDTFKTGITDIIKDFSWREGDKIQISKTGFGASSLNQFSYSSTGDLFFIGTQFATLENQPIDFNVSLDVELV